MSKKVQLILNGKAAGNDALKTAVARQRAIGHTIEVRVTSEKGDARRFVAETGEVDLLIAAGGDGTLNEVVHGLMDLSEVARPVLGVVPLGTANDFATGCGIPHDPEQALALCIEGDEVAIDAEGHCPAYAHIRASVKNGRGLRVEWRKMKNWRDGV